MRHGEDERAEPEYRRGFEAAFRVGDDVRSYGEAQAQLREIAPDAYDHEPFRAGFERGLAWRDARRPGREDSV